MKKIIILLSFIFVLFFSACGGGENGESLAVDRGTSVDTLDVNITEPYQLYVEKTLVQRVNAFHIYENSVDKDTLSGSDLLTIHTMLKSYLEDKTLTEDYINKYQYLIYTNDTNHTQKEQFELLMISLSAMLTRYDDYLLVWGKFEDDSRLKSVLNSADSAFGIPQNTLDGITLEYELESDRETIKNMLRYYHVNLGKYENDSNSFFLYLRTLIEDSPSYQLGFDESFSLSSLFSDIYDYIVESSNDLLSNFFFTVSEKIGNTAGLVETREGKLYNDASIATNVKVHLQVGDILIERTPFRLTDKLIPGYFGHIAIYLGDENELMDLGVWDDLNSSVQAQISSGKVIEEALRDGVQLNTIEHFLNIDDLVIMHDTLESDAQKRARILLAVAQLGKAYDFEYDIESSDKIVCSELVYVTSVDVDWQTENLVGINTISPDNVAVKATEENSRFLVSLMYHDGELVLSDAKEYLKRVMNE